MNRWIPPSKRRAQAKSVGQPLAYQYDTVPDALRRQVVLILQRALGNRLYIRHSYMIGSQPTKAFEYWDYIFKRLREERGEFKLSEHGDDPNDQVLNFILNCDTDGFIDAVELCLIVVHAAARRAGSHDSDEADVTENADDAIVNINYRFQEHRFGYSFVPDAGEMIQIDSQYLHANVVEEAFQLLQRTGFSGAENEFQEAHREYRDGHHKDAITKALNAVESTIKTICDRRKWAYPANASSKELVKIIFDHELVAKSHETFFAALRSVLESGLPTVRNKSTASHGQGATVVVVPPHVAAFALHLAASSIVLLVEADKAKK
jgi:HEPN domain-containing protein